MMGKEDKSVAVLKKSTKMWHRMLKIVCKLGNIRWRLDSAPDPDE